MPWAAPQSARPYHRIPTPDDHYFGIAGDGASRSAIVRVRCLPADPRSHVSGNYRLKRVADRMPNVVLDAELAVTARSPTQYATC